MADTKPLHRLYLRRSRKTAWVFDSGWSSVFDAENAAKFYCLRGYMTEVRSEAQSEAQVVRDELIGALNGLVEETVEYMTVNHLGDPEKQHNIRRARAALERVARLDPDFEPDFDRAGTFTSSRDIHEMAPGY